MDPDQASRSSRPGARIYLPATIALAAIAIGYPVWRGLISPKPEVDFRSFWFAGYLWSHGKDPYQAAFSELGKAILPPGNHVQWFYPPNWWLFCRALALFDFPTSLTLWRVSLTLILLASTAAVVALLTRGMPPARRSFTVAGACALATTIEPSGNLLTAGQVSPILIYLGLALVICAQITSSPLLLAIGLVLTCLKPQIGLLLVLAFAFSARSRRPVLWALAASALLSLPQLVLFGPVTTAREMLANLASYSQWEANSPLAMTGPSQLLARMGLNFPLAAQFFLGLMCAAAAGIMMRRDEHSITGSGLLFAGAAALVPLHIYDMTILLLVAALLLSLTNSRFQSLLICVAVMLCIRPSRVESVFGVRVYGDVSGGAISYSIAAILLLSLAIYHAWARRSALATGH